MEKTTIYVIVERYGMSFLGGNDTIRGFTLSKEEAEFIVYSRKKEVNKDNYIYWSIGYQEVTSYEQPDKSGKIYKTFIDEKKKELQKAIDERVACSTKDTVEANKLREELAFYETKQNPQNAQK
jgi:hypothetical protein